MNLSFAPLKLPDLKCESARTENEKILSERLFWFFCAMILHRREATIFFGAPLEVTAISRRRLPASIEGRNLIYCMRRYQRLAETLKNNRCIEPVDIACFHKKLCAGSIGGRFRNQPVKFRDPKSGITYDAKFPAPLVHSMLESLCEYISKSDPCIQRSINIYAWIVIIHPFADGNGRVARLLSLLGLSAYERNVMCLFHLVLARKFNSLFAESFREFLSSGPASLEGACLRVVNLCHLSVESLIDSLTVCFEKFSAYEDPCAQSLFLDFLENPVQRADETRKSQWQCDLLRKLIHSKYFEELQIDGVVHRSFAFLIERLGRLMSCDFLQRSRAQV